MNRNPGSRNHLSENRVGRRGVGLILGQRDRRITNRNSSLDREVRKGLVSSPGLQRGVRIVGVRGDENGVGGGVD